MMKGEYMSRTKMKRMVGFKPKHKGIDGTCCNHEGITITIEELEALRLADVLMNNQSEAAEQMGISRGTFQRIIRVAREKSAMAVLLGLSVEFEEGHAVESKIDYTLGKYVIAVPVDGNSLSEHFGRCEKFLLFHLDDGAVVRTDEVSNNWKSEQKSKFILIQMNVDMVITRKIGEHAKEILEVYGIKVDLTNSDNPREAVTNII